MVRSVGTRLRGSTRPSGTVTGPYRFGLDLDRRLLRADRLALARLGGRAAALGPIDGGAIVLGLLDALEVVDAGGVRATIELGLGWPRGGVRLAALDALASIDPEAARRRAAGDPDRKVRAWTTTRRSAKAGHSASGRPGGRPCADGDQSRLFSE
jgi:hypothetical protein